MAGIVRIVKSRIHTFERLVGRPRRRWEDNKKLDIIKPKGSASVDWMHLAQDRDQCRDLVNTGSIKGGEFLDQLSN